MRRECYAFIDSPFSLSFPCCCPYFPFQAMAKRSPLAVRAQLLLGLVSLIAFVYLWAAERRRTIGPVSEDLRKTFSSTASQPTTNTNCKFTMITIATSGREYRRLHRLLTNRQRYARRHGYEWQLHLDAVYPPDPMWSKIPAIELALFGHSEIPGLDYPGESYEDLLSEKIDHVEDTDDTSSPEHWAWWFDTDAFITNQNVELAAIVDRAKEVHKSSFPDGQKAPPLDLILSRDCNGLNAGSYLVRKSAWSRRYLHAIWMLKSEIHNIDPDRTSEQDAMAFLLHNSPDVQKRAVFAPQKVKFPHEGFIW